jgi:hypothetical protein
MHSRKKKVKTIVKNYVHFIDDENNFVLIQWLQQSLRG